ncbi:aminopeptidase [Patescibacteria group bacterium]|nr:aminopeptidase [Patescibacteria group bacterium]
MGKKRDWRDRLNPRYVELADLLVNYSTEVEGGNLVLLQTDVHIPHDMHVAVIETVREAGGVMMEPILSDPRLTAAARKGCTARQLAVNAAAYETLLLGADVRIAFRAISNKVELSSVPGKDTQRHSQVLVNLIFEEALQYTRWVLTSWPTPAFAQLANMSTGAFEDLFFGAVLTDYAALGRAIKPLATLMNRTKKVKITGPDTDLSFSIEDIPTVICAGDRNIPDGEAFTAAVLGTMEGHITFNTISVNSAGQRFEGIRLEFRKGKVVKATCRAGNQHLLEQALDTDEGARQVGEFAFGLNPNVTHAIGDTLFDEKIGGTLHMALGRCIPPADNGNSSSLHWDIVLDQRKPAGGGSVYFDGKLVRKNGLFVPDALQRLNRGIQQ